MPAHKTNTFGPSLARVSRIHLLLAAVLALQIIIFDAGKLITPDVVLKRWLGVGVLAAVAGICWFQARTREDSRRLKKLFWLLIVTDIAFASWYVYLERGMASKAVLLYALPIISSAILVRKGAIYLTAGLSIIAYILTTNAYFVHYFNEGYKLELYGEVLFYCLLLFLLASIQWAVIKAKHRH